MADITAGMVKELREKTDAPMMECKKALTEADGDLVKAEELLRVKLGNKASKAASRVTAEGIVTAVIEGRIGVLVEINCETDFVAKNPDFLAFAKNVGETIARNEPASVDVLLGMPLDGKTVDETRAALVGKIGENLAIRRFVRYETTGKLASYLHGTRIGVLVDYDAADEQVGKDVAMHIAASKPLTVSRDEVPADKIEAERKVLHGAGRGVGQARRHRRQDGRGPRVQVPGRSRPARAAVRQEPRRDGREDAQGEGARRSIVSRCTSSARASRSARTTSRPKWRRRSRRRAGSRLLSRERDGARGTFVGQASKSLIMRGGETALLKHRPRTRSPVGPRARRLVEA